MFNFQAISRVGSKSELVATTGARSSGAGGDLEAEHQDRGDHQGGGHTQGGLNNEGQCRGGQEQGNVCGEHEHENVEGTCPSAYDVQ